MKCIDLDIIRLIKSVLMQENNLGILAYRIIRLILECRHSTFGRLHRSQHTGGDIFGTRFAIRPPQYISFFIYNRLPVSLIIIAGYRNFGIEYRIIQPIIISPHILGKTVFGWQRMTDVIAETMDFPNLSRTNRKRV